MTNKKLTDEQLATQIKDLIQTLAITAQFQQLTPQYRDGLESQLSALQELQQYRTLAKMPLAWTDEQELNDFKKNDCAYYFKYDPENPHHDPRRQIMLYRGASIPAPLTDAERAELQEYRKANGEPVADVVAWNKPGEERTCDIRWRRFDVAPGPLYTAPPLQGDIKPRIAPHKYRECVNELTVIAKRYAAAGQLREQITTALSKYIEPDHPHTRNAVITCWSCKKSMTALERSSADGFCPHCNAEIDIDESCAAGGTVEGGE